MVDQSGFSIEPRAELMTTPKVAHGGGEEHRGLIDFSVCLNPYPLPPAVRTAIADTDPCRYPDNDGSILREKLAEKHHCSSKEILLSNGISQAIFLTAFAFIERGDRVLITSPSYGEYEKASRLMGGEIRLVDWFSPTRRDNQPSKHHPREADSIGQLVDQIREYHPKMLWVCNPNNPTGDLLGKNTMDQIRKTCLQARTLLVIDEAYMNFADPEKRFHTEGENCITLHSMTKDFSIPGLRLGYLKAPERLLNPIGAARPEWSLNAVALVAGEAALTSLNDYQKQWKELRRETLSLASSLSGMGFEVIPPAANVIMFQEKNIPSPKGNTPCCGKGPVQEGFDAQGEELNLEGPVPQEVKTRQEFLCQLKEAGMVLRDCSSFGLPGWYRIGTRLPEHNHKLIEVLKGITTKNSRGVRQWEQ